MGKESKKMIRKLKEEDIEEVMKIWLKGNKEAHPFVPENYWEKHADAVQKQLKKAEVYVAETEGKIQGFAGMTGEYLAGIFVEKGARSKGVGKKLLDDIKEKYAAFTLNVYKKNKRAAAFYIREGLTVLGEGKEAETGEDEYTMAWNNRAGGKMQK